MLGAHRRSYPNAVATTDAGAVTGTDAGTDARTDDGDARAHTTAVGVTHTCALLATDDGRALSQAHASALLI